MYENNGINKYVLRSLYISFFSSEKRRSSLLSKIEYNGLRPKRIFISTNEWNTSVRKESLSLSLSLTLFLGVFAHLGPIGAAQSTFCWPPRIVLKGLRSSRANERTET